MQPRRGGLFRLQVVAFEPGPALQRVVVPRAPGQVLVHVQVAMGEDVQAGALLVADQHGHGVLKFLAEAHVQHARIEAGVPTC